MDDEEELVIAAASGLSGQALLNATDVVKRAFGVNPTLERLPSLAGPNDVIQLLLPFVQWGALALIIRDFGGKAFADQIAKRLADEVFDKAKTLLAKRDPAAHAADVMNSLKQTVASGVSAGNTVIFGFKVDDIRNIGLAIDVADDKAIAEATLLLAQIGPKLLEDIRVLNAEEPGWYYEARNPDCSGKISRDENGNAQISVRVKSPDPTKPGNIRILTYRIDQDLG